MIYKAQKAKGDRDGQKVRKRDKKTNIQREREITRDTHSMTDRKSLKTDKVTHKKK